MSLYRQVHQNLHPMQVVDVLKQHCELPVGLFDVVVPFVQYDLRALACCIAMASAEEMDYFLSSRRCDSLTAFDLIFYARHHKPRPPLMLVRPFHPKSAHDLFLESAMTQDKYKNVPIPQIMAEWNALSDSERLAYSDLAFANRLLYEDRMARWTRSDGATCDETRVGFETILAQGRVIVLWPHVRKTLIDLCLALQPLSLAVPITLAILENVDCRACEISLHLLWRTSCAVKHHR